MADSNTLFFPVLGLVWFCFLFFLLKKEKQSGIKTKQTPVNQGIVNFHLASMFFVPLISYFPDFK